jgi:peptide/nickel transport system permease protein
MTTGDATSQPSGDVGADAPSVPTATELAGDEVTFQNPRSARRLLKRMLTNPSSLLAIVILTAMVCVAIAAPLLAPCPTDARQRAYCGRDVYQVPKYGFSQQPQPPSAEHPFGTTSEQYDIYYGVVWGTRTAFKVGTIITALSLLIGLTVGSISAYYGGWIDEGMMRVVEVFQAFPFFLAAITLATILRTNPWFQNRQTLPAIMALVAFGWMGYARLVRADILSVKQRDFVWAARSLGAGDWRIITRHVLPNSIYPVLVLASLEIGTVVVTFAALSFFGLGVPGGYADWGQMISSARNRIFSLAQDWYVVVFPGMAIVLFSLSWNLLGDTFRDLLDPRLTGRKGA